MERRASAGKLNRRNEQAGKGEPARESLVAGANQRGKASRRGKAQSRKHLGGRPWGRVGGRWEGVESRGRPFGVLGDALGNLRDCLERPSGTPWEALGGFGGAFESLGDALGRLGGPTWSELRANLVPT